MKALSDICAAQMPDVAKIQAFARQRWHEPQKYKTLEQWRIAVPGQAEFVLSVGPQDGGQVCQVFFAGKAEGVIPAIETRYKVSNPKLNGGMKIWLFNLNGKEGMVFLNDNPKSRYNVNVGIYLE